MGKSRSAAFLIAYALIVGLLFYGLVRILDTAGRNFFMLELLGLLVLLGLSLAAFLSSGKAAGQALFFTIFLLYLINLVLVWYFTGALYLVLTALAILGFILSFPSPGRSARKAAPQKEEEKEELHSQIFEEPKEETVKSRSATAKSTTAYSPGKYVASRNSNVYHEPKCDWAKKIEKSRQVWFDDKKEAVEKGFRMHGCVQ